MDGYIFILAVIILGGAIATVGDRIGSRVGKARLSLFGLRPKNTAVLVTILTGSIISASTLGILFAINKELRTAVFRFQTIQRQLQAAREQLQAAETQKQKTDIELKNAKNALDTANSSLQRVNRDLATAVNRQKQTQIQLDKTQTRFQKAQQELQQFSQQSATLKAEVQRLQVEAQNLQTERRGLISQREQVQGRLQEAETQTRQLEGTIKEAQTKVQQVSAQRIQLLRQQERLQTEVASLESSRKRLQDNVQVLLLGLRRGNITVRTGQVLAIGQVQQIRDRAVALAEIEKLLRQARQQAIVLTNPQQISPDQQVIQITKDDVERLAQQISDGQSYVVRILSAANYLEGETSVLVVPQLARNQVVFSGGDQLASVKISPTGMTDEQILNRLAYLFSLSNQRAIQSGMLPNPVTGEVGEFKQLELFRFALNLKQYEGEIEISTVVPKTVYTRGPLQLELVASRNEKVILRSSSGGGLGGS